MTQRILVVDDDLIQVDVVSYLLRRGGFEPVAAFDAAAAIQAFAEDPPALVILDVQLGKSDGLELLQQFKKQQPWIPILLLTILSAEDDRVRGLELGADDYLTKPFGYRELIARVRAMLRRGAAPQRAPVLPQRIELGTVVLDPTLHEVTRDGQRIDLSPTEFRLLTALMERPNTLVPTRTLLSEVWGHQDMSARNVLRVTASRLRAKLEPDPAAPQLLHTVAGEGLMFRTDQPRGVQTADSSVRTSGLNMQTSERNAQMPEPAESPVALEVISELRELMDEPGSPSLEHLTQVFRDTAQAHLAAMRTALVDQDARTIAREAHRLRGSAGSLGAQRMTKVCATIEACAGAGDLASVPGLLDRLETELASYQREVSPLLR